MQGRVGKGYKAPFDALKCSTFSYPLWILHHKMAESTRASGTQLPSGATCQVLGPKLQCAVNTVRFYPHHGLGE